MASKRRSTREPSDIEEQLDFFVDAPPDDDEDDDDTSDDDVSFEDDGSGNDGSSSDEESVYSGLSELTDDDEIGDIITLKNDSESDEADESSAGEEEETESKKKITEEAEEKKLEEIETEKETQDSNDRDQRIKDVSSKKTAKKLEDKALPKKKLRNQKLLESHLNRLNEEKQETEEKDKFEEDKKEDKERTVDISSLPSSSNEKQETVDEYEYDSSDEEDIRNTVGNIPMEWYDGFDHIGYNVRGEKIIKPPTRDELDEFLSKVDNPDYWRTVFDKKNGEDIVLTDEDLDIIERIQRGKYPDATVDPYEPYVDFFTYEKMIHPLTRRPEHKRSFIPSLSEKEKVSKYVGAMKRGWMKTRQQFGKEQREKEQRDVYYNIWTNEEDTVLSKRQLSHIPAPKVRLPGHAESYNPPPEYLMTEEEKLMAKSKEEYSGRPRFIPQKYDSLRTVPFFRDFFRERFERCLDLYLCPRQRKLRTRFEAEDLLPKLPKPKDLQPFPTTLALLYVGHTSYVRSISVDPTGQWLASGSDDKTVRFWEVATGRCLRTLEVEGPVQCVAWNPNAAVSLVAFSIEDKVHIVNPKLGDKLITSGTDQLIADYKQPEEVKTSPLVEWFEAEEKKQEEGFRLCLKHFKPVRQVTWHGKGDYFSCVIPTGQNSSVIIHQLSKRRSQNPFRKSKGLVQCTSFHPTRPFFFVATQKHIRVYNLIKQEMTKKLLTSAKWISSIAIHPGGDNVIVGTYDCKLSWFDLDLSVTPYQNMRHHKQAIRSVCFHKRYPLFASASDDGHVIVFHGQVYNDLLQNPLIVPVKVLKGHSITNGLGVLCCEFHPNQPWIFSSAADGIIRLFS
ncbi:Ribosome biogenesis protein bop1 [Holothuria leucospilota]|uniref:Ribosome biogenesis protein BOP1 homolog n=1 Tax=Holothuria leucospilota TaxID=206669 RepID=A0A9Q1CBH8_HOLLE|nr:Ribosome biogenesis protein bop1 [Holothuria leucospilota]